MAGWTPIHHPPEVPRPKGPYTPAVRAGEFIFVSGQVPHSIATGELVGDDVATQTRQVLSNVRDLLRAAGATMADVVSVTVYLQRSDDWGTMNEVYGEFFREPQPARTTVGADLRGILVEISAIAHAPVP